MLPRMFKRCMSSKARQLPTTIPRIYLDTITLLPSREVTLDSSHAHHLVDVLRLSAGSPVLVYNERDGEYLAHLQPWHRRPKQRQLTLDLSHQTRQYYPPTRRITLYTPPIRPHRMAILLEKATELGAHHIIPYRSHRTQHHLLDKARRIMIEASEQCGRLDVPCLGMPDGSVPSLMDVLERASGLVALEPRVDMKDHPMASTPSTLLVGPEGGFDEEELAAVDRAVAKGQWIPIRLSPYTLRTETAALAGLCLFSASVASQQGRRV